MPGHPSCPFPALNPTWPRVGPWLVLRPLGSGGMGSVFAATGPGHSGEVALKIIDPARSGTAKARLLAEARAAAAVLHPNLVRCLDIGESCDLPYLVMELVRGGSAHDLIGADPVGEDVLLAVAADTAAALGALHAAGVLHRDVKPANLLRSQAGVWQLADFGLARINDGMPGVTSEGNAVGTPDYMSPEQATAGPLDGRTDLYGLGAALFHLATGRPPHDGKDVWEVIGKLINDPFPDPLRLRPGLSPHVAAMIRKLGSKRAEERYVDARQLADDLALLRAGRAPVHARYRSSTELLAATCPHGPRLLLIDDDPLARGLYGAVLRKRGWQVVAAEDGARGLAAAGDCDVAVVDLVLPDIEGSEVVRRILAARAGLPVVVMTNAFTPGQLFAARASGASLVLDKAATTPGRLAEILAGLVHRQPVAEDHPSGMHQGVLATADAALARVQLLVQRMSETARDQARLEEITAAARGLFLAATATGRPAAAALGSALEELARELMASPQRCGPGARRTMHQAVAAMRPLLVGGGQPAVGGRVLVVDDDPTSRLLAARALGKVGLSQVAVDSPRAALAHLRSNPCDLLLTDVVMDGGGGFHLAAQARQVPGCEGLPIIFVTAMDDFALFFQANEAAGIDLLGKPYLLIELGTKALVRLAGRQSSL